MVAFHFIRHSLFLTLLFFNFYASKKIESTQLGATFKRSNQKIIQSSSYIDTATHGSYVTFKGHGGVTCVGGLIAPDTIITTARCVSKSGSNTILKPEDISIEPGVSSNNGLPLFSLNAQKITIHPSYSEKSPNHNNIALIKLEDCVDSSYSKILQVSPSEDSIKSDHYYLQSIETSVSGSLIKIPSENLDPSICGNILEKYSGASTTCLNKKGISNSANRKISFLLSNDQENIIGIASDFIEHTKNLNAFINKTHNNEIILDSNNDKNKETEKKKELNEKITTINDILVVNLFNESDLMFINANVPCSGSMCDRNLICDKSNLAELSKKINESKKKSDVCEISLDPVYLKANSDQHIKGDNIITSNSIALPCPGLNFQLSFNVAQISDILFTIDNNAIQENSNLISGKLGIVSGEYNIGENYTNLEKSNNQVDIVNLKIELNNNTVRIQKNNKAILVTEIKNKLYKDNNAEIAKITLKAVTEDVKLFDIKYSCLNEIDNYISKNVINKRLIESAKKIMDIQNTRKSGSKEGTIQRISEIYTMAYDDNNIHIRDTVDSQNAQNNINENLMCDQQLIDVTNLPGSSDSNDPTYDSSQIITIPCNTIN
ncbi:hypothetical protein AYI70_g347, partial [Smittium culicis]